MSYDDVLKVSEEVREALTEGRPVVALESTIIAHGLPRPRNLRVATELEELVRAQGAVPATVAVLDGRPHVGLDKDQLERIAGGGLRKLGHRDLPMALAAARAGPPPSPRPRIWLTGRTSASSPPAGSAASTAAGPRPRTSRRTWHSSPGRRSRWCARG